MIILQHTHMARAVCSLPPKRKRKDILRSFLQFAVFYVLTEDRIEWRTASHEKTSINASSSLQIRVRCRIKVYRVFYIKKRNYDVEVGKLCAIRSLYQPALTLRTPYVQCQCCTALQYYGTPAVRCYKWRTGTLLPGCIGTGNNTLQLVRLKLAPYDHLSSSNFDVIFSFFNVENTVYRTFIRQR
jgi:hypothetical protein